MRAAGGDAQHAEIVPSRQHAAIGRDRAGDGEMRARLRIGAQLQAPVAQAIPVGVARHGLARQEPRDHVDRVGHAVALRLGIDAEHHRVGREQSGAEAEHGAPARLVVELHDAVGDHERMVIGQRDDAGAEPDAARALGGGGDEELGLAVDLVAAGMVLADPRLVEAQLVEPLHELEIALHAQERVLVVGMERRQENAGAQRAGHAHRVTPLPNAMPHSTTIASGSRD